MLQTHFLGDIMKLLNDYASVSLKGQIRSDTGVFLLAGRVMGPEQLLFKEQLNLFSDRGMDIENAKVKKLENISYYRLKEFARPLSKETEVNGKINIDYTGVTFTEVLARYYQDKNLRIFLLHAIEKIEVSVKTNLSYILGEKYGAFGYLDFSKWSNRENFSKYTIQKREMKFKKQLLWTVKKLPRYSDARMEKNTDSDGFPTVWLALNILTFGELVSLIEVLSSKNLKKLSSIYDCTGKEFVSWMKTLHLVRNTCSHNSNIIDISIKTEPMYREEWNDFLYMFINEGDMKPTNKLSVILAILKHFISIINVKYQWKNIYQSIDTLCKSDKKARLLGFKNKSSLRKFKDYRRGYHYTLKRVK